MNTRESIQTNEAPQAIGPYSQGVVCTGTLVFVSGQIPIDPKTGLMVGGDIQAQTEQVMLNLGAVLRAAHCDFGHIVRSTIFLTDMNDFGRVNEVYARFFAKNPPARATVQVSGLPKGAQVEIDCIAVK